MHCPFLQVTTGRFCEISPFRKTILRMPAPEDAERCSSPDFAACPALAGRTGFRAEAGRCPFLREAPVQFCSVAPDIRFIPYSEAVSSSCRTGGYRYCDLYLERAHPGRRRRSGGRSRDVGGAGEAGADSSAWVEGLEVPRHLAYTANHLWIDLDEEDAFHLGVDSFLVRLVGEVRRASFPGGLGTKRPVVVLRVGELDLQLIFPHLLTVQKLNPAVQADPRRIADDPYGSGWLLAGAAPRPSIEEAGELHPALRGLVPGADAAAWMRQELSRVNRCFHDWTHRPDGEGRMMMADGGAATAEGLAGLPASERLLLLSEALSPAREGGVR